MDKKIAVLGDIHANLDALDVVLADAKELGATDWICVGDVVGYNACPNECCEKIRALGAATVCGNHDHYCAFDESLEDFHPLAAAVVAWTRRQLSTENREWLRSLPYQKVEKGLTIVHATLDQPEHWGYVFESVEAEPSFSYQKTQGVFYGVDFQRLQGRINASYKLLKNLEEYTMFKKDGKVYWQCRNCGFIIEAEEAPEKCPAGTRRGDRAEISRERPAAVGTFYFLQGACQPQRDDAAVSGDDAGNPERIRSACGY